MTFRKVSWVTGKNRAGVSAGLAQTRRRDAYGHGLAQDLDQHHEPTLAIGHLADAFYASERGFRQSHALSGFEQAFRLCLNRCLLHSQKFDQAIIHPRRFDPKADQSADALGRANWRPTLG